MSGKPPRRWLRFSLRTLFVLVGLAGIGLGWLTWKINVVRNQRQVLAELKKLDASISYVHQVTAPRLPPGPEWLRWILGEDFFYEIGQITISGNRATDDTLARIATLPRVDSLIVWSDAVTDRGLAQIPRLGKLRALEIESAKLTAADYRQLENFRVDSLVLSGSNVDDSWMPEIAKLKHVRYLSFRGNTRVTDAGLAELSKAPNLQRIFTNVKGAGVEELQKALPNCKIMPAP